MKVFLAIFLLSNLTFAEDIDLLLHSYDHQYKELIRRVDKSEHKPILMNLIGAVNTISQKYTLVAPQIRIYDKDIASQYTTVVNLLQQLEEQK